MEIDEMAVVWMVVVVVADVFLVLLLVVLYVLAKDQCFCYDYYYCVVLPLSAVPEVRQPLLSAPRFHV